MTTDTKQKHTPLGWFTSNNEAGEIVIQRDDEMGRFNSDEEAVIHVEKSYYQLLEALKYAKRFIVKEDVDMDYINQAIQSAKSEV